MSDQPTIKAMSFGAGVQSITEALLIAEGKLEKPHAAIFSDTGWEPAGVYATLDRVEREIFQPLGIPLYRVSNGVIQDDILNPDKMRAIPAYTASQPYEVKVVDRWGLCPVKSCGWRKLRQVKADSAEGAGEMSLFAVETADLSDMDGLFDLIHLIPLGATLSEVDARAAQWAPPSDIEIEEGDLEDEYVAASKVAAALRRAGLRQVPGPHDPCNSTGLVATASHTETKRDYGMLNRKCTQQYKLRPILEQVRLLLGAPIGNEILCRYCNGEGKRVAPWRAKRGETVIGDCSVCEGLGTISRVGPPPAGAWAEQWIGFSTDEIGRVSNRGDTKYSRSRYPLLELDMSRAQCIEYLEARGWGNVTKSSCLGCPFKSNAEWRRLRDTDPQAWAEVVAFDKAYRHGAGMTQQRYLHASCLPLDEAPIDVRQPREWKPTTVTDQVYAAQLQRAEDGDPDGCSPWACRSGRPVDDAA
ncbi:hypothetical protein [Streptomyces sp. NPDC002467]|uniref:hypothetical protein n=1 Tax=Streptomyces sp. NPDC002467 TaxID=3364647 RepID=UPI0036B80C4E